MQELLSITIILAASLLATQFSGRIGIPAVVGQLLVGILIGPAMLGWVHSGEIIHFLAELGVILLMFLAGLEADLKLLQKYLKPSLLVALTGVLVPMVVFFLTLTIMGHDVKIAVFYKNIIKFKLIQVLLFWAQLWPMIF